MKLCSVFLAFLLTSLGHSASANGTYPTTITMCDIAGHTISSANQLIDCINAYPSAAWKLTADIDFARGYTGDTANVPGSVLTWDATKKQFSGAPIANEALGGGNVVVFTGSLDGQGHTIANVKISDPLACVGPSYAKDPASCTTSRGYHIRNVDDALIAKNNGKIMNITMIGAVVQNTANSHNNWPDRRADINPGTHAAALVADNYGTMLNVHVTATISDSSYGGMVGMLAAFNVPGAKIMHASCAGSTSNTGINEYLGGCVGHNAGLIGDATATGTDILSSVKVTSSVSLTDFAGHCSGLDPNGLCSSGAWAGGIAGGNGYTKGCSTCANIYNSEFSGSVTNDTTFSNPANYTGGIVGAAGVGTIQKAKVDAGVVLIGSSSVGGVIGYQQTGSPGPTSKFCATQSGKVLTVTQVGAGCKGGATVCVGHPSAGMEIVYTGSPTGEYINDTKTVSGPGSYSFNVAGTMSGDDLTNCGAGNGRPVLGRRPFSKLYQASSEATVVLSCKNATSGPCGFGGGIVGSASGLIQDVRFNGTVKGDPASAVTINAIGGLVGELDAARVNVPGDNYGSLPGRIIFGFARGRVIGSSSRSASLGGLLGMAHDNAAFANTYTTIVPTTGTSIGTIIGQWDIDSTGAKQATHNYWDSTLGGSARSYGSLGPAARGTPPSQTSVGADVYPASTTALTSPTKPLSPFGSSPWVRTAGVNDNYYYLTDTPGSPDRAAAAD